MFEAEMDEHLGYEKNSALGNYSGNTVETAMTGKPSPAITAGAK